MGRRGRASAARTIALAVLRRLGSYDRAVYSAVARLSTPLLDEPLRRVSGFANFSKPWFITAGFLAVLGGPDGRRAAITGVAAIGAASLVVNQPMKMIGERRRPNRNGLGVPQQRWVTMPSSTSFPSGHSASAAAFAVAVGDLLPALKASVAWRSVGRRILACVHGRALPDGRSRWRDRGRHPRPRGFDSGTPRLRVTRSRSAIIAVISFAKLRPVCYEGSPGRLGRSWTVHVHPQHPVTSGDRPTALPGARSPEVTYDATRDDPWPDPRLPDQSVGTRSGARETQAVVGDGLALADPVGPGLRAARLLADRQPVRAEEAARGAAVCGQGHRGRAGVGPGVCPPPRTVRSGWTRR